VTPIIYRESANADLGDIRTYYTTISERTFDNVITDIYETISILNYMPEAGFIYKPNRRRLVSSKYRFVINYAFGSGHVEIVGIYRFQNRAK